MAQPTMGLAARLAYVQKLKLRGFDYPVPPYGGLAFRSFSSVSAQTQFDNFVERVYQSLGHAYLPIYRMADGEFSFLVGWRASTAPQRGMHAIPYYLRQIASQLRRQVLGHTSSTIWGEVYTQAEKARAQRIMQQGIRHIAEHGILALYFAQRADHWGEQYVRPVCDWFDSYGVRVVDSNYIPFYSVYALLNGPSRVRLYDGKHILVITHLTETRKSAIYRSLMQEGVASARFYEISSNHSMFDHIDVATIQQPVDLVLVAAGIGSVNILQQLELLSVPCIDCGISLDCLVDFNRRLERPFLLDNERIRTYQVDIRSLRFLKQTGVQE